MEELKTLVIRSRSGDLDAYGEIVRKLQDMAYGYAYSVLGDFHLAQDVAQEAFIQAYRDLKTLRKPEAFAGWLRKIVFKHCDRVAREKHSATAPLEAELVAASGESDPAEAAERQEMKDAVLRAIRLLPEMMRTVTTLFYINGYSQKEIAEFLEVPATTVKNRLYASRKRLKERMLKMVGDTLASNAPKPDECSDQVAFLLKFADRISKGEPILYVFDVLAQEAKSEKLRIVIGEIYDTVAQRGAMADVLAKHKEFFPPLVTALISDAEYLADERFTQILRMAAQWLREGKFRADPQLFVWGTGLLNGVRRRIKQALDRGACEMLIDSTHLAPPRGRPPRQYVCIELVMPDGKRKKVNTGLTPEAVSRLTRELKARTILSELQEGDSIKGVLQIQMEREDADETCFPIAYRPLRDGEEIRIRLKSN